MTISEIYNLEDDPTTWAATLTEACKKFFFTNGVLPHCVGLHDDLFEAFPKALEQQGFQLVSGSLMSEILEQLEQMEEIEDMSIFTITKVVSPKRDLELIVTLSDEPSQLQFQLSHIDGTEQPMN